MTIAVLLSTYNGEKYIREQIDSILAQKDVNLWLYIRDDGSTDTTTEILKEYANNHEQQISLIFGENIGYVKSFSELLFSAAKYDYYAFSDQDDYWEPEKLKTAIDILEYHRDIPALYYSNLIVSDENLIPIRKTRLETRKKTLESVITRRSIAGCTIVLNRTLYQNLDVEGHSPDIIIGSHDNFLVSFCYSIGGKVICDPNAYIRYRQHGSNTSGSTNGIIKRIKKEIKEANNLSWNEPMLSNSLIENYETIMSHKSIKTLKLVGSFPYSFIARLKAFFSFDFTVGDIRLTVVGKIKMLFNKL